MRQGVNVLSSFRTLKAGYKSILAFQEQNREKKNFLVGEPGKLHLTQAMNVDMARDVMVKYPW